MVMLLLYSMLLLLTQLWGSTLTWPGQHFLLLPEARC
jgi:hypothetical protein